MGFLDFIIGGASLLNPLTIGSSIGQGYGYMKAAGLLPKGADTVNYRGDVLSDTSKDVLGAAGPTKAASMFANWLTGGKPAPVDPGVALARSAALAGVYQSASAGRGMGGLFGLSKILGGPAPAPMQAGVPYSVPPIPNLFKPGGP